MNLKKIMAAMCIGVLSVTALAGCTGTTKKNNKTVKLGYVNWAEGVAMTNLAKAVLEDKMGYKVDLTMGEAGMIFTSVAENDLDAFLDAWLPVTHKDYMDRYKSDLDDLGTNYDDAKIGLVVPKEFNINSIEELNKVKDKVEGKIIGIDAGAGIMKASKKAIEDYKLNYELLEGSGPAMTTMLKDAVGKKKPIVVTGWKPHWMFARWNLKFLEDPKHSFGDVESIHTVSRKGFKEDMPEVAEFLKNFKLDDLQLGTLMGLIEESNKDPLDCAKEWIKDNEDLVNSWIPKK
ncbi:glycine betaine ABC transporter substrate-binding protein [Clostridium rectalis]|uniref:glycine betaine ABC transporter substrate-binding protein n=1 Tax=Clostridium rectalis TaxID=2040295 RepID=UPI000F638AD5|nr:glycine betaine ABC transporter substrate-binding protein [Clostridium rectalis]